MQVRILSALLNCILYYLFCNSEQGESIRVSLCLFHIVLFRSCKNNDFIWSDKTKNVKKNFNIILTFKNLPGKFIRLIFAPNLKQIIMSTIITPEEIQQVILCHPLATNKDIANALEISEHKVRANRNAIASRITRQSKKTTTWDIQKNGSTTTIEETITETTKTKVKTTFHHENSQNKDVIYRDSVIEAIQNSSIKSGDVYGLSASEFLTEKRIYNEVSKNFNFFSCENDDKVLYELYNNLGREKFKMTVYNKNLGDVLKTLPENSIAHLIADYCGQLHTNYIDIVDAISRNIVMVDGVIAITVNKRITGKENVKWYEDIIELNNTETYQKLCKVENAFKIFLERICGFNYKIEKYLDYRCDKKDGGKGANMMLAIIRRVH